LCCLVYFGLAANQLFLTPITGLADNRDFAKVLGPSDICDPSLEHDAFDYVYAKYRIGPDCSWDSGLTSSESLFVGAIKRCAEWSGHRAFRITGAGKIHLSVLLLTLGVLLWALHATAPVYRFGLPPLVMLIFSDVAYLAYLNSFYMDAGSLVLLLLTVSLAIAAMLRPSLSIAIAFGGVGLFFVTCKAQHAPLALPLAALAIWFAFRSPRSRAVCWIASAVAMLGGLGFMVSRTPAEYKAQALTNLIFYRFTPNVWDPVATLAEFGLPESYMPVVGTHAYSPNAPIHDEEWQRQFLERTSFRKVGIYYLRHPMITLGTLGHALTSDAPVIRPENLANYERESGFPPHTQAHRFDWWSNFRSWLLRVFPAHLVILYFLVIGGAIACLFRPALAAQWPLYPLALVFAACGIIEFLVGVLGDCLETARHLFLFQVITEILIVYGFAAILSLVRARAARA